MRVLLITYYWPPAGGVAVQRWLKFASLINELPEIELVVYAPENADYPEVDADLLNEVKHLTTWRHSIFEPYALFRMFTGKKKGFKVKQEFASSSNKGKLDKLAVWIRGNFFIPDARKFWIGPSVRFLKKKWKDNPFDCVITNGTPHSVHLIALGLKKHFKFRWIADLRDPWTKVDYFEDLHLSDRARNRHISLEKEVMETADHVVTVSPTWAKDLKDLGAGHVSVVTNGFDPKDFPAVAAELDQKFSIAHIGNLNNRRNKPVFWKVVSRLCDEVGGFRDDVQIRLVGMVDKGVDAMVNLHNLQAVTEMTGMVSHADATRLMQQSRLLLLLVGDDQLSEGRIPAKVFEYMAARRPIIAITPQKSDVKTIIEEVHAGSCVTSTEEEELYNLILQEYDYYLRNQPFEPDSNIDEYSRQSLARRMAAIIKAEE